ncbi:MAG: hypothetical protein EOP83_17700 [Verrucomicrobiaceae bacterium]|nr:MAG: hypothetical protein EOP83_17700 [Verrucomicrobiaceae bacterium]
MMQEFTFPSEPAVARRLVQLSRVTTTQISVQIEALAEQGLLRPADFAGLPDLSEAQQKAVQRIIDYRMRAALLGDSDDGGRRAVLAACKLQGVRPILVCTRRVGQWTQVADLFGFSTGTDPREDVDVLIVNPTDALNQEVIRDRRGGLLVIEHSERMDFHGGESDPQMVREFAQIVVLTNFGSLTRTFHSWTRQCDIALTTALGYLWPDDVLKILTQTPAVVNDLRNRGFTKYRPADLHFLFNVVPDLLEDRGPR